ncbi:MAG: MaoC family dehydratase [Nitrososphaerota archaeon]
MTDITDYKFDQIDLGLKKEFTVKITESMIADFAKISGDYNPLHMDEKYAKSTTFKNRICHGMLLATFFSRLIGMHLPGKHALYFSQSLNFQNPCFVNDVITIKGEVIDKSVAIRLITIKTSIYNQERTCLLDGVAKVVVRK